MDEAGGDSGHDEKFAVKMVARDQLSIKNDDDSYVAAVVVMKYIA
jgi:hypothetical protein